MFTLSKCICMICERDTRVNTFLHCYEFWRINENTQYFTNEQIHLLNETLLKCLLKLVIFWIERTNQKKKNKRRNKIYITFRNKMVKIWNFKIRMRIHYLNFHAWIDDRSHEIPVLTKNPCEPISLCEKLYQVHLLLTFIGPKHYKQLSIVNFTNKCRFYMFDKITGATKLHFNCYSSNKFFIDFPFN